MNDLTLAIPTWNNPNQLSDALLSLVRNTDFSGRILVINNGEDVYDYVQAAVPYDIDWLNAGSNIGWMKGINLALAQTDTEYFCMCNDDVLFPPASTEFWYRTYFWFKHPNVGGVGPTSNYVAGFQSAYCHVGHPIMSIPYLIGMCATYRTDLLKELGGLDESLPGGDDLDLSIRIKDRDLWLIADRRNYLHHVGSQTGRRIQGNDWDSPVHQLDYANALIRKHGLKRWYDLVNGPAADFPTFALPKHHTRITRRAMQSRDKTVDGFFAKMRTTPSDTNELLDILFRYASGCKVVCEFGVADCTTTAAFLKARPDELHSYDIRREPAVDEAEEAAAADGQHFEFHLQSTLDAVIPECDMLYIDDYHTYQHVRAELERHAGRVRKYIAFHDTEVFLDHSEDETRPGIWKAVADFLREHPEWVLSYSTEDYSGLTVITRIW